MKTLLATRNVNIRLKRPHRDAPAKGRIFKGFKVTVEEEVVGENINGISRWYRSGEEYYWGGGFSEVEEVEELVEERGHTGSGVAWNERVAVKKPVPTWWKNTGKGIRVAVLSGGFFHEHDDLRDALAGESHGDFTKEPFSNTPGKDKTGKGTGIAGIIAGRSSQPLGSGVVGMAPEAKIRDMRIMDGTEINGSGINHALRILTNNDVPDVDVVVLGQGLSGVTVRLDLIQKLVSRGAIFIVPAGDATPGQDDYLEGELFDSINHPGQLSLCLSIGTINSRVKELIETSNKRPFVSGLDYLAPRQLVYSCNSPDSIDPTLYRSHEGSPFAAAFVAGLVARILEGWAGKSYRLPLVREQLDRVALDIGSMEFDGELYQPLIKPGSRR